MDLVVGMIQTECWRRPALKSVRCRLLDILRKMRPDLDRRQSTFSGSFSGSPTPRLQCWREESAPASMSPFRPGSERRNRNSLSPWPRRSESTSGSPRPSMEQFGASRWSPVAGGQEFGARCSWKDSPDPPTTAVG